jgi:predicted nucleic acid-binding protein
VRVLIDTSVLSLSIRRKNPAGEPVKRLQELIASGQQLFVCGLVLTEILSSIKHGEQLTKVSRYMEAFPLLDLDRKGYVKAAKLMSDCRRNGIQCGTIDALIAQTAINHDCRLFTTDSDFLQMTRFCELELL